MTDKVQKIREMVERKLDIMQYQVHRKDAYKELKSILDYIDSLQEEPVSEDLEKYSALIADELPQGVALTPNGEFDIAGVRRLIIDACKYGAQWQEEKSMNISCQ
jgi:hypothetical protein